MANYPCADCGTMVDTAGTGTCSKCGSKRPFKCSKCGRKVNLDGIFKPEKLTFSGKPLYCIDCGSDVEQVKCASCGLELMRSSGVEVPKDGEIKVYHKKCLEEQQAMYKRLMPLFCLVAAVLVGYLFWMFHPPVYITIIAGLAGIGIGKFIADKVLPH